MKLFRFLLRHSSPGRIVPALLATVISGLASVGFPALVNAAIQTDDRASFVRLGWAFLAICLIVPGARLAAQYLLVRLSQEATFNLRVQLARQLASAPLRRQESLGLHRLMACVSEDLPALTTAIAMLPAICVNIALVASCLAYLGWLSRPLLPIVVVLIAVGIVATQLPTRMGRRLMQDVRDESDVFFKLFRAVTEGAKEIKIHGPRRQALLALLEASAERLRQIGVSARMIFNTSASLGQLLFFFIVGAVLFGMAGLHAFDRAVLVGYALVLFFMKTPLQGILENLPDLSRAEVAMHQLAALGLSLESQGAEFEPDAATALRRWERLELVGVAHTYSREDQDDAFTLGPIDLAFRPGELVFLVGGNGSGKTTLAKLLIGLYAPQAGEVRLDGVPVTAENRDRYRQLFSVVFSDFFLFDILLGVGGTDLDERAQHYLAKLHLERKVSVRQGELSTTALSQGQRKRLALLTAYLEGRPIYLFDEWAADQDPVFKELFYRQLLPELKAAGKTVFVISHDDRYYPLADRLVKLENGGVAYDLPVDLSPYGVAPPLPVLAERQGA